MSFFDNSWLAALISILGAANEFKEKVAPSSILRLFAKGEALYLYDKSVRDSF